MSLYASRPIMKALLHNYLICSGKQDGCKGHEMHQLPKKMANDPWRAEGIACIVKRIYASPIHFRTHKTDRRSDMGADKKTTKT